MCKYLVLFLSALSGAVIPFSAGLFLSGNGGLRAHPTVTARHFLSEPDACGPDIPRVSATGMKLDLPVDIGGRFL